MAKQTCSGKSLAVLGVVLGVGLGGCDAESLEQLELEAEHEFRRGGDDHACGYMPPPNPVFHDPPVDCTESQDVGYDAGTPFDITVVTVDGKKVEKDTANAFWVMRQAAAADGVDIHINSGFRTMAEQEYFWMCYQCGCCNNGNLAAQPGYSNHQSGHALDLNTASPGVYNWLVANGGSFGFTATVPSENWHWEWWGGGPGGGICDIASPPAGSVDASTCDAISGWAQDPDAPEAHLAVQVVIDGAPGEPQAIAFDLVADIPRDDLCEPLGSCDHAFELELPLGLRDGTPHAVRVFAIDSDGGENTELAVATPQVQCDAPALPDGVRRPLPSATTFATWGFESLWDVAHVHAEDLAALDEGPELGDAPFLVTDATGLDTWLVDKGVRRPILDPDVAAAWRFDLAKVVPLEADQLADIPEGTPLRDAPLLATDDGVQMWLIDDRQTNAPDGGGGSASGGGGSADDGDGDGGSDDDAGSGDDAALPADAGDGDGGGCACRVDDDTRGLPQMLGMLGLFALARVRRGRRAVC